jgi:hypothetical protein
MAHAGARVQEMATGCFCLTMSTESATSLHKQKTRAECLGFLAVIASCHQELSWVVTIAVYKQHHCRAQTAESRVQNSHRRSATVVLEENTGDKAGGSIP